MTDSVREGGLKANYLGARNSVPRLCSSAIPSNRWLENIIISRAGLFLRSHFSALNLDAPHLLVGPHATQGNAPRANQTKSVGHVVISAERVGRRLSEGPPAGQPNSSLAGGHFSDDKISWLAGLASARFSSFIHGARRGLINSRK